MKQVIIDKELHGKLKLLALKKETTIQKLVNVAIVNLIRSYENGSVTE